MGTGWGINNRGQALIKADSGLVKFDKKELRPSFVS
jgi:hypothetical protein